MELSRKQFRRVISTSPPNYASIGWTRHNRESHLFSCMLAYPVPKMDDLANLPCRQFTIASLFFIRSDELVRMVKSPPLVLVNEEEYQVEGLPQDLDDGDFTYRVMVLDAGIWCCGRVIHPLRRPGSMNPS